VGREGTIKVLYEKRSQGKRFYLKRGKGRVVKAVLRSLAPGGSSGRAEKRGRLGRKMGPREEKEYGVLQSRDRSN